MNEHKSLVFSFEDVQVHEREFCIVKGGEVLPVEPKAFRVLIFLLRSPHRLITKDELLDAVWHDCSVSENSLTRSIALLRRLLGDDTHEPRYIATVPTVGYRFLCNVQVVEDGFRGVEEADLHYPDNGNELGSLAGTPSIQSSSQTPQSHTAVVERLNQKVQQPLEGGASRSNRLLPQGVMAIMLVLLVTGFLVYRTSRNRDTPSHAVQSPSATAASSRMSIVPLTDLPGWVRDPAFSPDGEKIAFFWNGENPVMGDLYVQLVGGERPLRLTHTDHGYICCEDWSPDGREIAFGRCDDKGGGVFTVPALGGPERKLTDVICPFGDAGYPKWTGDRRSLVLADRCTPDGARGIVVFSLATGEKRCLTAPPPYSELGDSDPALSPDGKMVAFERHTTADQPKIYTVALSGGDPRQLTINGWGSNPMWSSDGQHIIFNSGASLLGGRVWRVPAAGGTLEPEAVYPATGSLSRDGRRLAFVEPSWFWQGRAVVISRIELSSAGGQVVSQKGVITSDGGNQSAQPSPDGRQIVFQSSRSGITCEIWRSDSDGSNPLQLTSFEKGFSGTPRWSPDGKWIAFDHHHDTHSQIYLIDAEGRNMHAVTTGNYENVVPGWSRDGTAVYFASNRTGSWQLWRKELANGREAQVTQNGGFAAFESYDAKTLYFSKFEGGGIWTMPVGGGQEQQVTDALHRGYWGHFAVTDAGLYLLNSEAAPKPTLMFYNFQTRLLTPVLQLENSFAGAVNLAASRDGRTLWSAQQSARHSSIAMAENFQ